MEVVEHVADVQGFLAACGHAGRGRAAAWSWRPSTARSRSFALGIVAAEYILGWLPRGTHRWSRFVRPSEAARAAARAPASRSLDLTGVAYDPLRDRFRLSPDPAVNYMLFAVRDGPLSRRGGGSQGIWPTLMPSSTSSLASARVASP